jgi:hypothetical protein
LKTLLSWNPIQHRIIHVMRFLKQMFYSINLENAVNMEATKLLVQSFPQFQERVNQCVQASNDTVYQNPQGFELRFSEHKKEHDKIRNDLLKKEEATHKDPFYSNIWKLINMKY